MPPTQHTPRLHRDVEAICLKALEKDPAQRYPSAAELADDIDRYLEGEPVQARAPGRLELLARQARRHKIVLQASAAVAAIALLAWGLVRLQSSRAASEVADAHTKVQEEKKQYQEKIAEITKGIEDLKKDRDHRKAGQAYEEMLKGATTDEDRRKLTGQIEDAKIMEDLHARLVKSVAETRKKGETLHTTDGKEVSGDVLMADQEMVILYADGRSVEVPWSKVRTADYDRFLRTYLSEPDDETAFALGIYAQSQGDYEWARRSYLLVPTDAKLRTRAEAKLAELGYETESARETRLKMERDRDEEERERQARQKAEQTFRKIVTDAEKLAREHDYDRALAGLKAAARNPEMMSLSRKFEGEMQVLEHGRKGWLMRAAGLTDWIGKEIVIPRGKSSLRGNLESLESSGTLVLSGPTAEARVRVKWEDLSDNLRSEAVSAALRRDASLALPYVLCRVLDGDLEAAERLEYLFPETTAFGLPETEPLAERLVDRGILFRYFGQLRSRADLARSELFERGGTVYSREHLTVSKDLFGRSGRAYTAEELRALGLYGRSGVAYTLADLVTEGLYGRDGVALTPDELRERQLYEHDGLAFTLSEALSQGLSVGPFASRFGTLKQSTLKSGGGTAGSEEAVRGALCWLARHQNPDGSWSAQTPNRVCGEAACGGSGLRGNDVGVTALALLTFLGAGCFERSSDLEHFSKKHQELNGGEVVSKATAWLVSKQDADGCVGGQVGKYMYNHLAGTLALVEASALSESSSLRQAAQSAVDFTLAAQNPYKGWRYGKRCGDNDTSVTGWAIMALKSASLSTLKVGQAGFDGAKAWIMEVADDTYYKAGYTSRGTGLVVTPENQDFAPHEAITAIAMMCRMCIDRDWTDPALEGGAKMLMDDLPTWDPVAKKIDFYYWHYGTLALYQYDGPNGPHWTIWNKAMISALVPNQRTAMDMCAEGSWDADTKNGIGRWAFEGGRVYTTAMAALTLETCYRYPSMFPSKDRPPGPSETSRKPGKTK
ncbi:MAG: hypothetical protein HYY93_12830 [Planctomycetes bacterium]|nr:hypothetical protein [Planctomycetota bacterium]